MNQKAKKPDADVYKKLKRFQELCVAVDEKSRDSREPKPIVLKRLGVSADSLRAWGNQGKVPSNASVTRLTPIFEAYLKEEEIPRIVDVCKQLNRIEALLVRLVDAFVLDDEEGDQ